MASLLSESGAVAQVVGKGLVSGVSSKLSGGSFERGLAFGAATAGLAAGYKAYVGFPMDPNEGGSAVVKMAPEFGGRGAVQGANNIGTARIMTPQLMASGGSVDPISSWKQEGS